MQFNRRSVKRSRSDCPAATLSQSLRAKRSNLFMFDGLLRFARNDGGECVRNDEKVVNNARNTMNKIWIEDISLDAIAARSAGTMAEYLSIEFTEVGDDFLKATMPIDGRTKQPLGILNGGASCALAETVSSTAANFCVSQATHYCVGLDINANHLRPAREGLVTATTRPIHLGRSTQVWHIDIHNHEDKLNCVARMTVAVMQRAT